MKLNLKKDKNMDTNQIMKGCVARILYMLKRYEYLFIIENYLNSILISSESIKSMLKINVKGDKLLTFMC